MIDFPKHVPAHFESVDCLSCCGWGQKKFIHALQEINVTPHAAQNTSGRRSAVPDTINASAGYASTMQKMRPIEQGFGWTKTAWRIRQVMVRGLKRIDQMLVLTMAAHNLSRMRSLGEIRLQPV